MYSQFMMHGQKNIKLANIHYVTTQKRGDPSWTAMKAWNLARFMHSLPSKY